MTKSFILRSHSKRGENSSLKLRPPTNAKGGGSSTILKVPRVGLIIERTGEVLRGVVVIKYSFPNQRFSTKAKEGLMKPWKKEGTVERKKNGEPIFLDP